MGLMAAFLPTLTSMFLHGSWMHVIGNMWFLWIFGDNIEDYLGHFKYLLFYLLSGLGAAFAQVILNPHSSVPTVGASGAIAGVLGAYFLLYPRGESADLVSDFLSLLSAGLGHAGLLVRDAVCERRSNLARELQRYQRRRGILGARRRLCRGHRADQDHSRTSATLSLRNLVRGRGVGRSRDQDADARTSGADSRPQFSGRPCGQVVDARQRL